jgi:hypothetical protein
MDNEKSVLDLLSENGEWWRADRFRDPRALERGRAELKDVEEAIAVLRRHFPPQQAKLAFQQGHGANAFIDRIIAWGCQVNVRPLLDVAAMIQRLEGCSGFALILDRIKGCKTSKAAWFEMQMGSILQDVGLEVEFPASGRSFKSPDVIGRSNACGMAVECKSLDVHQIEEWIGDYYEVLWQRVLGSASRTWRPYKLHLLPFDMRRLPAELDRDRDQARALAEEAAQVILEAMDRASEAGEKELQCEFAIGRFCAEPQRTSLTRESASVQRAWDKILSKGIKKGSRQLAGGQIPGVVAIITRDRPELMDAQHHFVESVRSRPEDFSYCSGVLLIPWHNMVTPQRPVLLVNPFARQPVYQLPKIRDVLNRLQAIDLLDAMQDDDISAGESSRDGQA